MSIIADSSALFSLVVETDKNHDIALKCAKNFLQEKEALIIPGDVFSEVINVLGRKISHKVAVEIGRDLLESNAFAILDASEAIRKIALGKLQKQPESVSFTDCIVMAFADDFKTKEIFGFDESFAASDYKRVVMG